MDTFADKVGKMSKGELLQEGTYQFFNLITTLQIGTIAPTLAGASASEVVMLSKVIKNFNLIFKKETALAKHFFEKHHLLEGYHQVLTPLTTVVGDGIEVLAVSLGCEKGFGKTLINFAQKDKAFLRSKFLGKSLPDKLKNFAQRFWDKRKQKTFQTGARDLTIKEWEALEKCATIEYEKIRNMTDDIAKIAKNTGIPEHQIRRIKQHIFHDIHKLEGLIDKFSPDFGIAKAWNRLIKNDLKNRANDLSLLKHELFESRFESFWKTTNKVAHERVQPKTSWNIPGDDKLL